MTETTVIYHGFCDDGFASAYAVWKAAQAKNPELVGRVTYQAAIHETIPQDMTGRHVLMVDFTWPTHVMMTILKTARHVTIIDHHRDAIDEMGEAEHPNLELVMRGDRSGAVLTWERFMKDVPVPDLLLRIDDAHMKRGRFPDSEDVMAALRSHPHDFAVWDQLDVGKLASEGAAIRRYVGLQVEELLQHATTVQMGEHLVPCLNAPTFIYSAELGARLAKDQPFSIVYWQDKGVYSYSLRSGGMIDVSRIAQTFGGGGSKTVAGFRTTRMAHKPLWGGDETA